MFMKSIKVLTVRQPFAGLIVLGLKTIENRSWTTGFRGTLLIHAAKKSNLDDWDAAQKYCKTLGISFPLEDLPSMSARGAIIGCVFMNAIIQPINKQNPPWYIKGNYGWVLSKPYALPFPIPISGKLGLWNLPPDIQLNKQIQDRLK